MLRHSVYFPDGEVDAADLYPLKDKLGFQLGEEVVYLSGEVVLKGILRNHFVVLLGEPLDHSVLHFANASEICEILLQLVAVWRHVLGSIIVADVRLIWQPGELARLPLTVKQVQAAHQRGESNRNLSHIIHADGRHRDAIRTHIVLGVELPLLLVNPLPATGPLRVAIELELGHLQQ